MTNRLKVYFWSGEHPVVRYVTWAAGVTILAELRRLCAQHQVKYPAKPWRSRPGRPERDAAAGRPGVLLFSNVEDPDDGRHVLPTST